MANTYTLDQFYDKRFTAAKDLTAIKSFGFDPGEAGKSFVIKSGALLDPFYSYFWSADKTKYYLMFKDELGRTYYIPYTEGAFTMDVVKDNNIKSKEEQKKEKERENETLSEKAERLIVTGFKWALGTAIAISLGKAIIQRKRT